MEPIGGSWEAAAQITQVVLRDRHAVVGVGEFLFQLLLVYILVEDVFGVSGEGVGKFRYGPASLATVVATDAK